MQNRLHMVEFYHQFIERDTLEWGDILGVPRTRFFLKRASEQNFLCQKF